MREVGKARLSWYTGLTETFGDDPPSRDHATIVIPHLHPGRDAKSRQAVVQRRVYCLTHFITITYADTAIDLIRSAKAGSFDRQGLCEYIMDHSQARLERAGFWPIFQRAKDELAVSWAQDRGENQHVGDIKGQQDLNAKDETAQAVIKKTAIKRASRRRPTWYPDDAQVQEIPNRKRSPLYDIQKLNHGPVISIGQKAEHHKTIIIGPDSSDRQAVFRHPVIDVKGHSNSGRCFDNDDIPDSDSFSESEEAESYTFNRPDFVLSILPAERAYTEPGSRSRRRQLKKLWKANIPALHENQSRTACNRIAFENFMSEQPQDYWFIACIAAIEEPGKMCTQKRDILLKFRPSEVSSNEEWLTRFENRREAFQWACRFYLDGQSRWQTGRKRGLRLRPKTAKEINGGHLHINPHAVGKISWQRSLEDPVVSLSLSLPKSAIPLVWFDKRTIHFHENGIDVKDENYVTFYQSFYQSNEPRKATLLKDFFEHSKSGQALVSLWEEITGLKYVREGMTGTTSLNLKEIPIRQYGSTGRPLLKSNHNLTMNPQNSPPQVSMPLEIRKPRK